MDLSVCVGVRQPRKKEFPFSITIRINVRQCFVVIVHANRHSSSKMVGRERYCDQMHFRLVRRHQQHHHLVISGFWERELFIMLHVCRRHGHIRNNAGKEVDLKTGNSFYTQKINFRACMRYTNRFGIIYSGRYRIRYRY